jgi:hypothetical protein
VAGNQGLPAAGQVGFVVDFLQLVKIIPSPQKVVKEYVFVQPTNLLRPGSRVHRNQQGALFQAGQGGDQAGQTQGTFFHCQGVWHALAGPGKLQEVHVLLKAQQRPGGPPSHLVAEQVGLLLEPAQVLVGLSNGQGRRNRSAWTAHSPRLAGRMAWRASSLIPVISRGVKKRRANRDSG